jgi:hypothetical protein
MGITGASEVVLGVFPRVARSFCVSWNGGCGSAAVWARGARLGFPVSRAGLRVGMDMPEGRGCCYASVSDSCGWWVGRGAHLLGVGATLPLGRRGRAPGVVLVFGGLDGGVSGGPRPYGGLGWPLGAMRRGVALCALLGVRLSTPPSCGSLVGYGGRPGPGPRLPDRQR